MGRVAKYKKVKSFDPYSKKNNGNVDLSTVGIWGLGDVGRKPKKRSRRSEMLRMARKSKGSRARNNDGFDAPPDEDDFNLSDLVGSIKKKHQDPSDSLSRLPSKPEAHIPRTEREEREMRNILKVETKQKSTNVAKESYKRREGESKKAFSKRTLAETRQIIRNETKSKKDSEKNARKKEFLNNKKKKKQKTGIRHDANLDESLAAEDDLDALVTGERAIAKLADQPSFGEQVERPPIFRQLPRGAKRAKDSLHAVRTGLSEDQIRAEQSAMESMRRKVEAQYALVKARRRQQGDFHL